MDQVRLGVIGFGAIAKNYHIPAIAQVPEAKMVAVADLDEAKAQECAKEYDISDVYSDYRPIMERDDIHAVILLTRCDTHLEVVTAAADVGKHVFMQKPFAMTPEEGQQIVDIATQGKIRVVTSFMHRYMDETVKAGELIRDGAIGEVRLIRQRNCVGNNYEGAVRLWGGVMDIGPHGIDLIRFYSGGEKFVKTSAMMDPHLSGVTPNTDGPNGRAVDTMAVMNYELTNQVLVSHEVHWEQRGGQGRFMSEIYGTEGSLFVRPYPCDKLLALVRKKEVEYPDLDEEPFGVRHHRVFVHDVLNDTYESASVEQGLEVLCVTEANYQSAREGGTPVLL